MVVEGAFLLSRSMISANPIVCPNSSMLLGYIFLHNTYCNFCITFVSFGISHPSADSFADGFVHHHTISPYVGWDFQIWQICICFNVTRIFWYKIWCQTRYNLTPFVYTNIPCIAPVFYQLFKLSSTISRASLASARPRVFFMT